MDLNNMTVKELKDRLKELGLPVYGRKSELVERIDNHFAIAQADTKEYDKLTVKELKKRLSLLGLSTTGRKADLIARLMSRDESGVDISPASVVAREDFPTGHLIIDRQIMLNLEDRDLVSVCRGNKYLQAICNDNNFWKEKLSKRFDHEFTSEADYKKLHTSIAPLTNPVEQYLKAIELGNLELVQLLLDTEGKELDYVDGNSPLIAIKVAIINNRLDILEYLIDRYNHHNVIEFGLNMAMNYENLAAIDILLKDDGQKYMNDAAFIRGVTKAASLETIHYLMERGLDIRARNDLLIYYTVLIGNIWLLEFLLDNGADPNALHKGISLLTSALGSRNPSTIKILVERGADISYNNYEPLFQAVVFDKEDVVKYLVEKLKDDPNREYAIDEALNIAFDYENTVLIKYLKSIR